MRKKGFVEKIVMGKPAKGNFSADKFPPNRAQLFLYMLKNKSWKIYKNHWLTALFFVPLIIWGVITMDYTNMVFSLDAKEGITHLVEYWFTVYVTAIPMWALAFVGLAGGLNVVRKLAWSDPVIIKNDFAQGIKASGKQMALVGLLWGVAYALIRYAIDWLGFYYQVFDSSYSVVFGIFVCYFLLIVLIGITVYMCCMSSMYNVNLRQLLLGSFKLYFSEFFLATGVILINLLPILALILTGLAFAILLAYLLAIGMLIGIIIIPMFLVCQHTFDRIINIKDYPSYYGRGLSYGVYPNKGGALTDESADDSEEIYGTRYTEEAETDFERVNDDED